MAAIVLIGGCSIDGPGHENVTVRDSAGISIVTSAKPEWTEHNAWRVARIPSVVIGRVDGEHPYLLDRVRHALRLPDGRIVLVNGGTQELRFYGPDGRHISSTGGRGEGPGEYQGAQGLYLLPGDSLLVADATGSRFSVLDPEGRFVRSFAAGWGLAAPHGQLSDGRLITLNFADRRLVSAPGFVRVPMHLLVYPPDGSRVDTAAVLPGSEEFRVELAGGIANYEPPFGRRQLIVAGADRIHTGTGDSFEIESRGVDGSIRRLIRAELPSRPVRSGDMDL